jgi:hypothetical protein
VTETTGAFLLAIALILANLPFFTRRILFVIPPASGEKSFGWRLLEVVLLYFVTGGLARVLEARGGEIYRQNWEFYAITFFLFLVFAYPGFVYRYMWRRNK